MFFKRKNTQQNIEPKINKVIVDPSFFKKSNQEPFNFQEPVTIANLRLNGKAKDVGSVNGIKMYNSHKAKINNQWVSPLQSINSGFGTSQLSYFNYQTVNYWECFALAQDPLMNKVFDLLSQTPFSKGGEVVKDEDSYIDLVELEKVASRFSVIKHAVNALRSSYVCGGCLLFLDFGLDNLSEPLDLNKVDMRQFKGFRHIDPINIQAVEVNTINPSDADYMKPKSWYVVGLGVCHRSHFLHFEQNEPELIMRPLTMYFGMPLTQLIKADVANSNLTSQGAANLINRFRYLYMKTDKTNFAANAENFRRQLEIMSTIQDNWSVMPLSLEESIEQLTTSLAGLRENVELFYSIVAAKTGIPMTEIFGKSAQGMDATGEGDRKSWYDKVRRVQTSIKENLMVMYGICAGINDGKFVKFTDYVFNPLEELNEKEQVEVFKGRVEIAKGLIELGSKSEDVFDWLKSDKSLNIQDIEQDTSVEGLSGFDDILSDTDETLSFNDADFESKHKRDNGGKFSKQEEKGKRPASISDFLGEEFTGLKGQAAVDKLMQEKKGYVKDAFVRKDIGGIALVWGDDSAGLQHIIKRRKETNQNLRGVLSSLDDVISNGEISSDVDGDFIIKYKGKKVVVEPKLFNKSFQFVLTAYYEK